MIFSDGVFFVFFGVVFAIYLATARSLWLQNVLLLVSSYVFYGWWDPRFLMLIAASTVMDYVAGLAIADRRTGHAEFIPPALLIGGLMAVLAGLGVAELPLVLGFGAGFMAILVGFTALAGTWSPEARARGFVVASVVFNLGLLGVFKYFNFFADSFADFAGLFGWDPGFVTLNVILPVGISFYTFQTMSYTIDIRRGEMEPTARFHPLRGLRELLPAARRRPHRAGAPPAAAIRGPARHHARQPPGRRDAVPLGLLQEGRDRRQSRADLRTGVLRPGQRRARRDLRRPFWPSPSRSTATFRAIPTWRAARLGCWASI